MNDSRSLSFRIFSTLLLSSVFTIVLLCAASSTTLGQQVRLQLELTDMDSKPVDVLMVGKTYLLHGITEHLEEGGQGVFATYLDIGFDKNFVELAGPVAFSEWFPNGHNELKIEPGLLNDVGGFGSLTIQSETMRSLFQVPIVPLNRGEIQFSATEPGRPPFTDTLVYMHDEPIAVSQIEFIGTSAQAVPEPTGLLGLWLSLLGILRGVRGRSEVCPCVGP